MEFASFFEAGPGLWSTENEFFFTDIDESSDCWKFGGIGLSKPFLCISDTNDEIVFTAILQDGDKNTIPLDYEWHIRFTHEYAGDVDRILLAFIQGHCTAAYKVNPALPLGNWIIDESKFDRVHLDREYQVKLTNPVGFVTYRTLE